MPCIAIFSKSDEIRNRILLGNSNYHHSRSFNLKLDDVLMGDLNSFFQNFKDKGFFISKTWRFSWTGYTKEAENGKLKADAGKDGASQISSGSTPGKGVAGS